MKIAVMGAAGRMGLELAKAVHATSGCELSGALEAAGSPALDRDIGEAAGFGAIAVAISADAEKVISSADAILDFTVPAASAAFAKIAAAHGKVHVIGTTGFDAASENAIADAAQRTVIIKAGNMSLGVNLLTALVSKVAAALDQEFDIEIVEMHHRLKVDAPSGTALMLGQAAAEGRGVKLADKAVRSRDGYTGARRAGDIGFATLRGGSVVGDHTVIFAGEGERIELTHKAADRSIFARGAVKAALWGKGKPPGLYSMIDVLGLK